MTGLRRALFTVRAVVGSLVLAAALAVLPAAMRRDIVAAIDSAAARTAVRDAAARRRNATGVI